MSHGWDTTGWLAGVFAVIGGGGGLMRLFTTQSVHSQRIARLEQDQATHADKIAQTHTTVTRLDSNLDHVASDVSEIRQILETYRKDS